MNLYSVYHARYMAGFLLRDFIAQERKGLIVKPEPKISPLGSSGALVRIPLRSLSQQAGSFEDQSKIDLYDMYQKILKRYTDGNSLLGLVPEDSIYHFSPALISAFQQDAGLSLSTRLRGRKEVFCKSDAAGFVATKGAWKDITAITNTFEQATYDVDPSYEKAFGRIREFVDARTKQADSRAQGVILEQSIDFEIIP